MKTYTTKFSRIFFLNKWKKGYHNSGLIFGVMMWWAGPKDYCYKIGAFGFEISFWFERIFNKNMTNL